MPNSPAPIKKVFLRKPCPNTCQFNLFTTSRSGLPLWASYVQTNPIHQKRATHPLIIQASHHTRHQFNRHILNVVSPPRIHPPPPSPFVSHSRAPQARKRRQRKNPPRHTINLHRLRKRARNIRIHRRRGPRKLGRQLRRNRLPQRRTQIRLLLETLFDSRTHASYPQNRRVESRLPALDIRQEREDVRLETECG